MPRICFTTPNHTGSVAMNTPSPGAPDRLWLLSALAALSLAAPPLHAQDARLSEVLEGIRAMEGALSAVAVHRVFRYQPDHPDYLRVWDQTYEQQLLLENIADPNSRTSAISKYETIQGKQAAEERTVWDGTVLTWLRTIQDHRTATITKEGNFVLQGSPSEYLWWYFGEPLSAMMEKYKPVTLHDVANGVTVIEFRCSERVKMEYHVDRSKGFAVVYRARYEPWGDDLSQWHRRAELKCGDLRELRPGLWLPHRIEERIFGDMYGTGNTLLRADVCSVTWDLNPEFAATAFALEIPPGTLVDDQVTGKKYRVARLTDQAIADQVAAARRLAQEQGEKLASPGGARMLFAACAAIVVAGAFIVYRIKRRLKAALLKAGQHEH